MLHLPVKMVVNSSQIAFSGNVKTQRYHFKLVKAFHKGV